MKSKAKMAVWTFVGVLGSLVVLRVLENKGYGLVDKIASPISDALPSSTTKAAA